MSDTEGPDFGHSSGSHQRGRRLGRLSTRVAREKQYRLVHDLGKIRTKPLYPIGALAGDDLVSVYYTPFATLHSRQPVLKGLGFTRSGVWVSTPTLAHSRQGSTQSIACVGFGAQSRTIQARQLGWSLTNVKRIYREELRFRVMLMRLRV